MSDLQGIDLSDANGPDVDFKAVRSSGRRFVVLKVNEGDLIDQTTTAQRVSAVRAAGLIVGGYDYVHPRTGRKGAQEFQIHYSAARKAGLYRKGDMRPVLDLETSHFDTRTASGRNATMNYVRSWVDECVAITGHHPILYVGFFWRDELQDPDTRLGCHLWYPSYPNLHLVPRAWGPSRVSIHQYTDRASVPGVHGHVDLDRFLTSKVGPFRIRQFRGDLCLKAGPA